MSEIGGLPFLEHLEELRRRILVSLLAVTAGAGVAYAFSDKLLAFVLKPIQPEIHSVYFFEPAEAFLVKIKLAFFASLLVVSPIVIGQLWQFVSPGLYKNEKKLILPLALVSSALFIFGAAFSYYAVMPVALHFLVGMAITCSFL